MRGEGRRYDISENLAWYMDENGDKLTWLTKVDRRSRTLGEPAPARAIVLFGGLKTDGLANAHLTPDGLLKEGFRTKDAYQDYFLHLEFQNSYMPHARGQGRSNSGIYLQQRYEIQILDSFALDGLVNECGAVYRYKAPKSICAFPRWPGRRMTLTSARPASMSADARRKTPYVTVWHNGYAVQEMVDITRKDGSRSARNA